MPLLDQGVDVNEAQSFFPNSNHSMSPPGLSYSGEFSENQSFSPVETSNQNSSARYLNGRRQNKSPMEENQTRKMIIDLLRQRVKFLLL